LDNRCLLKSVSDLVGLHLLQGPGQGATSLETGGRRNSTFGKQNRIEEQSASALRLAIGLCNGTGSWWTFSRPFPLVWAVLGLLGWAGQLRGRRLSKETAHKTPNFEFDQGCPLFCFPAACAPRPAVPSPRARLRRLSKGLGLFILRFHIRHKSDRHTASSLLLLDVMPRLCSGFGWCANVPGSSLLR
jgi:hypothetical protein